MGLSLPVTRNLTDEDRTWIFDPLIAFDLGHRAPWHTVQHTCIAGRHFEWLRR